MKVVLNPYTITFFTSLFMSLLLTPAVRAAAIVLNVFDRPTTSVKTHKEPVPYLGGVAIFLAFVFALLWIRLLTSFPTGTLRSLRGIVCGAAVVFVIGLIDDVKPYGLHYRIKFILQILAGCMLILFGMRIRFIQPTWLAYLLTLVWIVGVTNSFNLIDIMDGLASGVSAITSLAFLFISLPTEEIYVNVAASALAGATLGFMPYNLSKKSRLFMGDAGSLVLGFVASSLAMGTSYSGKTELGVFAPLVILAVPIFDTLFVFYMRTRRGLSPFLGSKDHFALRLEILKWSRPKILIFSLLLTLALSLAAFEVTRVPATIAIAVYVGVLIALGGLTAYVLKAQVR